MLSKQESFELDVSDRARAVLSGVLRLPSPAAYEERFQPIREALQESEGPYTIDISAVQFLNSSGITGISRLVLLARSKGTALAFVGSSNAVWHEKTLKLIARLYDQVSVEIV